MDNVKNQNKLSTAISQPQNTAATYFKIVFNNINKTDDDYYEFLTKRRKEGKNEIYYQSKETFN